ncbi:MAG: Rv1355c family protein [Flavobacteriales bacterium]|nr:Rv1355c family protein [Flavobacteriales bacterium]
MMDRLEALRASSAGRRGVYRPEVLRLRNAADLSRLDELLATGAVVDVHDELHAQLRELVRALNPAIKFTPEALDAAATAHLNGTDARSYGVWVFYPWSGRLVHLLDEAEFVRVRTDRNRNKITAEEQELLATKRVGVIGLSVGQSVCLTMALERTFGELRIADFDTLDLSNLNRIRSGVHRLGHRKAVNVAREIAELDPFLNVTVFQEGITRDNLDAFLTEGGRLDVLVEECDGIDVKLMARQRAKALRIPVIMDTSDRGLLDVERFDLEPDRPILHGLVEHLDLEAAARARTSEEKLPFVLPILGLEHLSTRMKASMLEIESTVTTWPQLASSVVMGGGVSGHVARRILLGEAVTSGRWWLDPDDLMREAHAYGGKAVQVDDQWNVAELPARSLSNDDRIAVAERLQASPLALAFTETEAEALVTAGTMAPSGGNCQPWRFLNHDGRLFIFLDEVRAASALDPGHRYAHLAMGACLENMRLEAARRGLNAEVVHHPLPGVTDLVAVMELRGRHGASLLPAELEAPAAHIAVRCTNRRFSEQLELNDAEAMGLMLPIARDDRSSIQLVRDRALIEHIATLTGRAERIRFLNTTCHHDMFAKEMRWDRKEVERTRDGIDIDSLELPLTDRVGLRVASDSRAMHMLRGWGAGKAIEKLSAKAIRASSALAIISIRDLEPATTYEGGRTMQRFWLQASAMGILAHPVGAAIFMGLHGRFDRQGILSPAEHREAEEVLNELKRLVDTGGHEPFFLLRLGRAAEPTVRSLRKPLSDVYHSTPVHHA